MDGKDVPLPQQYRKIKYKTSKSRQNFKTIFTYFSMIIFYIYVMRQHVISVLVLFKPPRINTVL